MFRILAIGNSFSQDATKYITDIASAAGVEAETVNLYIGGCSLLRHYKNLKSGEAAYSYELNGQPVAQNISIQEAVADGPWDVVTLQQVSGHSGLEATYQPFLSELADYIREKCPEAKLYMHQTWSYDPKSDHNDFPIYHRDSREMYRMLSAAVRKAADEIDADIIPVGDGVEELRRTKEFDPETGLYPVNRDGFHLSVPYGRYFAGLIWLEALLGMDTRGNGFIPQTKEGKADPAILALLQKVAHETASDDRQGCADDR